MTDELERWSIIEKIPSLTNREGPFLAHWCKDNRVYTAHYRLTRNWHTGEASESWMCCSCDKQAPQAILDVIRLVPVISIAKWVRVHESYYE